MTFSSDPAFQSNQLPISIQFPKDNEEDFFEILDLTYKRIANAVNSKEGGLYQPLELASFTQFFTPNNPQKNRSVYRQLYDMVALNGGNIAAGATATFAHNITGLVACTRIYGTATTVTPTYLPLPYSAIVLNQQIEIYLTATNVVLVNGAGQAALSQAYVIAEYVKE